MAQIYHAPAVPLAITAATGLTAFHFSAGSTDSIYIVNTSSGTVITDNGVASAPMPASSLLSINIIGDTSGTLTVDFSNGDPLPAAGLFADSAQINFNGSGGSDTLLTTATAAIFDNALIRHPSASAVTFVNANQTDVLAAIAGTVTLAGDPNITTGGPTVVVNTQATVLFTGTQHLSALDILPGGAARMVQYGSYVLDIGALNISAATSKLSGGLLDLSDNDLIIHSGDLTAIAAELAAGYDGGGWDANSNWPGIEPAAIDSTSALNDPAYLESLGYAQIGSSQGDLTLSTFDGQSVATGDVIVKFTYYGDANLDGNVDSADQSLLDNGYTSNLTGWTNGDFEYNGTIDSGDFTLLDVSQVQNTNLPSGTMTVAADVNFPATSLPTRAPTGKVISSWQVDWGNGDTQTFLPTDTVPNLYPDATAFYVATFIPLNSNGNPEYYYPHMTINVSYVTPPAAPSGLFVPSFSSSEIDLAWTNDPSATMPVEVLESSNGLNFSVYATLSSTAATYSATGLSGGTQYIFEVETADGGVLSAPSNLVWVTTIPTSPPTTLSATAVSPNEIDLSWSGYTLSNVTSFNIFASTDGIYFVGIDSVNNSSTMYQVQNLNPATSYTFEVTAADNAHDAFTPSNSVSATTEIDPWDVQASGAATADEGEEYSLALSVDPSADSPVFDHYTVDWGDGSTPTNYSSGTTTATHVFSSGIDSSIIEVTASTSDGSTSPLLVTATPIEVDMIPAAPTDLETTAVSTTEIDLAWTDHSSDADGYNVLRSLDGGATFQSIAEVAATDTSYADTSLTAGATVQYEIEAVGEAASDVSSILSSPAVGSLAANSPDPETPTISITVDPSSSDTADLTWTYQSSDDNGFELEMADLTAGQNYQLVYLPVPVNTTTHSGSQAIGSLVAGDTYEFRIRADHEGGTASRYVDTGPWTPPAIGAPILTVTDLSETIDAIFTGLPIVYSRIRVGWSGIIPGADVEMEISGPAWPGNEWHPIAGLFPGDIQEEDGNLPPDTTDQGYVLDPGVPGPGTYSFRVRSFNLDGSPTAWSQPQSNSADEDGTGANLVLTATETSITATWPIPAGPSNVNSNDLYMQQIGDPGTVGGDNPGFITIPPGQLTSDGAHYTTTINNLAPDTTYEFSLWTQLFTRHDDDAIPDYTFTKSQFTTDGITPLTPPAAPAALQAVDLGDGVSTANIELIWENNSDQEDGYIIQRSTDSNFVTGVSTFRVGADQTNYIDSFPYKRSFIAAYSTPSLPIYYRVAAYKGNAQSGWVSVSITPSSIPRAMSISWLSTLPPGTSASGLEESALDLTANNPPPSEFSIGNGQSFGGYQSWSLSNYEDFKDYRNILTSQVSYSIDPYTGKLGIVNPQIVDLPGYTPVASNVFVQGQSDLVQGISFNTEHTSATVTVLAKFRLQAAENAGFFAMGLLALNSPHRATWAWACISYTINVDPTIKPIITFSGSAVPSQYDYINQSMTGSYLMSTNPSGINAFMNAPYGSLGPVDNR